MRSQVLISGEDLTRIIASDATARRILAKRRHPQAGDYVGVRLNLNVLKSTGVAIQTLHQGGRFGAPCYRGEAIGYAAHAVLVEAMFHVDARAREMIASGTRAKYPMASVDGIYCGSDAPADFSGLEIRFNPQTMSHFSDAQGRPISWAESVTVCGHRVWAQGQVVYA